MGPHFLLRSSVCLSVIKEYFATWTCFGCYLFEVFEMGVLGTISVLRFSLVYLAAPRYLASPSFLELFNLN